MDVLSLIQPSAPLYHPFRQFAYRKLEIGLST